MIFNLNETALQADLQAFLAIVSDRQARFDAAADSVPVNGCGVNAQQRRMHGEKKTFSVQETRITENGLLLITLKAADGAAPVYRPGQQARVYCPELSYPLFFAGAAGSAGPGCCRIAVSPAAQPEAFTFLSSRGIGDEVRMRCPVGRFYYLPPRDTGSLVFFTDPAGLPAAQAFAQAIPRDGARDVRFYCVSCQPEPFFDDRFFRISATDALPPVPDAARCFIAGSSAFCESVYARCKNACVKVCAADAPGRENRTAVFLCTLRTGTEVRTFPCSARLPLLSALEAAGVHVPAACSSGECGFCRCRLLKGDVFIKTDPWQEDPRRTADALRNVIHLCRSYPDSDLTLSF